MKKHGGYTLLEMMISISIFLMIMLTVGMGSISIQKTWQRVQKHSNNLKIYQMIDRAVSSSFKNAVPFNWRDDDGSTKTIFAGEENRVSFAYLHRMNRLSEGGIRFLKLFEEEGNLVVEYRNTPLLPWGDDSANVKREILSENVKSISFSYAYRDNGNLTWTSIWEEQGYRIPLAIQLTVEWESGDVEQWLRRTAGNGLREALSVRN